MTSTERAAVAQLCDRLPELRRETAAHSAEAQQLLTRIEAKARAGHQVRTLIEQLALELDNEPVRAFEPLRGLDPQPPSEEWFICPDTLCDREARTYPSGPLPHCSLTGRLMRRRDTE